MIKPSLSLLFISFLLNSCSTLPDSFYEEQRLSLKKRHQLSTNQRWWDEFNDPLINIFVEKLLAENLDMKISAERLIESLAIAAKTNSNLFPDISLLGSASRSNRDSLRLQNIARGGFNTEWELDLFGRIRAATSAEEARSFAAEANYDDVMNIILADLVRAVINWRQAEQTVGETQDLLKSQDDQVALLSTRVNAGLIDNSFAERARAQRAQTAINLPLAQAKAKEAQYQIERLLNSKDHEVDKHLTLSTQHDLQIPQPNNVVNVTLETLKDRPDIRSARALMIAAEADLEAAEAELWPRVTLSNLFSVQATSAGALVANNPIWLIGSTINLPLLDFGRLRNNIAAADARVKQAIFNYENVISLAFQETKTALSDYLNGYNAQELQAKALLHRQQTVKVAQERFERGLTDMTDLTTAQTELDQATIALIQRKTETAIAYIRLQKALGRGVIR